MVANDALQLEEQLAKERVQHVDATAALALWAGHGATSPSRGPEESGDHSGDDILGFVQKVSFLSPSPPSARGAGCSRCLSYIEAFAKVHLATSPSRGPEGGGEESGDDILGFVQKVLHPTSYTLHPTP